LKEKLKPRTQEKRTNANNLFDWITNRRINNENLEKIILETLKEEQAYINQNEISQEIANFIMPSCLKGSV
jgi:hypothetical protein